MRAGPIILISLSVMSYSANAAQQCYEQVQVPASSSCGTTGSNSADFTSSCTLEPARIENVEVDCPSTARWVGVPEYLGGRFTHAAICGAVGLAPANFGGYSCASGARPARSGEGWQEIRYHFGGGNGGGSGGYDVVHVSDWAPPNGNDGDSGAGGGRIDAVMCFNSFSEERTYGMSPMHKAVAVVCE